MQFKRRSVLNGLALGVLGGFAPTRLVASDQSIPLTQVAAGIYVSEGVHELFSADNAGHISNVSFIVGRHAVAVIDTGGSVGFGRAFVAAIARVTPLPVRYVINTHMHPDHVFGNGAFVSAQTTFVGHAKLPRSLAARGAHYLDANKGDLGASAFEGTSIVSPTLLVETTLQLDLGDRILTVVARPTAHSDNDLTVRDEKTGTLFLGDLLFAGHIPALDGSLKGWIAVSKALRTEIATAVVPGHGPAVMPWPQALDGQTRYLEGLAEGVRTVVRMNGTLSDAVATIDVTDARDWLLAEHFHKRNVSAAFAELEWE